ncbi:alpha-E domain-containing protein [Agaribacter flavus]|uniref:Alpha-E domain-containing protein n=1 Tax=Agaribacter flavus TaxID=1902781 RepID=A0ABV7FPH4_9ALTE
MLSRVAETLYWTARYIERAENVARLVNVNNHTLMDLPKGISPGWEPLIDIIGSRETYIKDHINFNEQSVIEFLTIGEDNPSSIINSIKMARDNCRTVRDVVPREMWEAINQLNLSLNEHKSTFVSKRGRFAALKSVINQTVKIVGILEASMYQDMGYLFWRFGSYLERADMTTRIIDVRSASLHADPEKSIAYENIQWISVLRSLSAYQMYRQHMAVRVKPTQVMEFMLHDKCFPRSVLFCLTSIQKLNENLPNNKEMNARIQHSIDDLLAQDIKSLKGTASHLYIDELQIDLADIHEQLVEQYFSHKR